MTDMMPSMTCPVCGETVQVHWNICPACETRLRELRCPACGRPVKENWKRCPECETQLICANCGRRMINAEQGCLTCSPPDQGHRSSPAVFKDTVCEIEMVFIPAGAFQMGDTFGRGIANELPVHTVELDGFYMARFPLTQDQWLRLMAENPSRFKGDDLPVEQVTWHEACRFAGLLTRSHQDRYLFGLPTEAQWEYAARSAGLQQLYAGGDDINAVAWYEENSKGRSHPVGTKSPNGLGLHDMSGNIWEWCRDTFAEDAYSRRAGRNPLIEDRGPDRVIRGGSWNLDAWSARCTRRLGLADDFMGAGLGFRLVMLPAKASK